MILRVFDIHWIFIPKWQPETKDGQYNGQKTKNKKTRNAWRYQSGYGNGRTSRSINTTQKTKVTCILLKYGG